VYALVPLVPQARAPMINHLQYLAPKESTIDEPVPADDKKASELPKHEVYLYSKRTLDSSFWGQLYC
jgi:hypothetical protein